MDPRTSGRTARSLETLHALGYFAPEVTAEMVALGVREGRASYFASRSAAMGPVSPGTVTATFFVFNGDLVAKSIPDAWAAASTADMVAARRRGIDAAYRRLLGDDAIAAPQIAEAAELTRTAVTACDPAGRPLYAAHADLAWPEEPHLALWHGLTLLREYRGDGHIAALLSAGLTGIEALVTHTATGKGFTVPAAKSTRGWSDEQWDAALANLTDGGILGAAGGLTKDGTELRAAIESATDEMAAAPWDAIGEDGTARLGEIGLPLVKAAIDAGAYPDGVFA